MSDGLRMIELAMAGLLGAVLAASSAPDTRAASSWRVYFGTGGHGARGIYSGVFDGAQGKLSTPELAHEIRSPGFLALHPDGRKLYAVADLPGGAGVAAFTIGAAGALTSIGSAPTGDGGAAHVAVHPSGRFLLTAQYGSGSVALFPLDAEGRLGAARIVRHEGGTRVVAKRQDAPHPHWCGYSPDGRFALVPDLGLDGIVIYRVDEKAPSIERHGFAASMAGGGARHMRFSIDGKFIHLLDELSLTVTTFAWDARNGTAEKLATVPTLSEEVKAKEDFNSAAEIVVHPTGRTVYTSNRGHDSITVFRADPASGALAAIQVQPVRGAFPRHIALAPDGAWLLAAGADSGTVSVHRVDAGTGELTYRTHSVVHVPAPICILFAASD